MKKTINLRQGDVFMHSVSIPTTAKKVDNRIVARGEWSDHSHVITGDADVLQDGDKTFVRVGSGGAKLQHTLESRLPQNLADNKDLPVADHGIIELEPDTCFEVTIQNEYNPYSQVFEKVRD